MAEEKRIIKDFFFPYIPKIIAYTFMAFVVPAPLLLCSDSCSTKWVMLAGYRMLKYPDTYALTFPRMIFMFATAYIASIAVIGCINVFRKKDSWENPSGKV